MPANVVKTPEQERLWNKAKKLAEKQGRGGDYAYIMGIFKQMGAMSKSLFIPPRYRTHRYPGQVPSRENLEAMRLANAKPPKFNAAMLLNHAEPMLTPSSIVRDLGFNSTEMNSWQRFLETEMNTAPNELVLRRNVMSKCLEERLDPGLRRALLQRSLIHWRDRMQKSTVQIVKPEDFLEKAKYIERTGTPGNYKYKYAEGAKREAAKTEGIDWTGTAQKMLNASTKLHGLGHDFHSTQESLYYRAYLKAIISGQSAKHLIDKYEGARRARKELIDIAGMGDKAQNIGNLLADPKIAESMAPAKPKGPPAALKNPPTDEAGVIKANKGLSIPEIKTKVKELKALAKETGGLEGTAMRHLANAHMTIAKWREKQVSHPGTAAAASPWGTASHMDLFNATMKKIYRDKPEWLQPTMLKAFGHKYKWKEQRGGKTIYHYIGKQGEKKFTKQRVKAIQKEIEDLKQEIKSAHDAGDIVRERKVRHEAYKKFQTLAKMTGKKKWESKAKKIKEAQTYASQPVLVTKGSEEAYAAKSLAKARYVERTGTPGHYRYRYAEESGKDWKKEAAYHEKEIQNIKKRLKQLSNMTTIPKHYAGIGAGGLNKLRQQLERHRVAHGAAVNKRKPTQKELDVAVGSLSKAEPRGGTYKRRVARKSGKGYTYYYDNEKYNSRKDAHISGEDAERTYLGGKIMKCVETAGKKGCGVDAFKDLVKKFGAKKVAKVLKDGNGGKLQFKKGKFYAKAAKA